MVVIQGGFDSPHVRSPVCLQWGMIVKHKGTNSGHQPRSCGCESHLSVSFCQTLSHNLVVFVSFLLCIQSHLTLLLPPLLMWYNWYSLGYCCLSLFNLLPFSSYLFYFKGGIYMEFQACMRVAHTPFFISCLLLHTHGHTQTHTDTQS